MTKRAHPDLRLAEAMRMLRYRADVPIKQLAEPLGVSRQAAARLEQGLTVFTPDKIAVWLKGVNATQDDLDRELAQIAMVPGAAVAEAPAPSYTPEPAANLERLDITDETMSPWVEPGEFVLFQRDKHPLRQQGCVLEFADAKPIVRLYERERDGFVFVRSLNPDRVEQYPHDKVIGRHKVTLRGS
jgi:transcriptional regulator with XRE-family HTH domain